MSIGPARIMNDGALSNEKPRVSKSSLAAPGFEKLEKTLFNTESIEENTTPYSVVAPGTGTTDQILRVANPGLLALNKKAIKSPHIINSSSQSKSTMRNVPITHGITSLLSKKPLSDLPEPSQMSTEIYQKKLELEKLALEFDEDPVAYFSKRKDGRGHLFIFMKYRRSMQDPEFSPYDLVKITHNEVGKDYFQMSANGVTHFLGDGSTEHISLDQWAREESIYKSVRKLRTFYYYFFWKNFRVWKNFITQQHYNETMSKIIQYPIFYNLSFASGTVALTSLTTESDEIISSYLLQIFPSRKYMLDTFIETSKENIDLLIMKYTSFIQDMVSIFGELHKMLSNQELLNVTDKDFAEIRRKNPNIGMLMTLERKKDAERKRREEQMNYELTYLGNFLRMLDYVMLESLRESCFKSFIEAKNSILQEQSAVFVAEVYFSDTGKVSFKPSFEELSGTVMQVFKTALSTLDSLPRVLRHPDLRFILTNSKVDVTKLLDEGPDFQLLSKSSPLIGEVVKKIIGEIAESYKQADIYAQAFKEFYPLYKLGKNWNVRNYIVKMDGTPYTGPLKLYERPPDEDDDEFLMHPENEPYVDFSKVHEVIMRLQDEEVRVKDIRAGIVKGAVYVDSKELRHVLTPIPREKLISLEETLVVLKSLKNDLITRVIKNYTLKLNSETTNVDIYINFCESLQRAEKIMPQIVQEIKFVDKINALLETEFQVAKQRQNPLQTQYNTFKKQHAEALKVQKIQFEKYNFIVKGITEKTESEVNKLYQKSMDIPITAKGLDTEELLKKTVILKKKSENLKQPIDNCNRYQKVIGVNYSDFHNYKPLVTNIAFSEALYAAVKKWDAVNSQVSTVPFVHIGIEDFKKLLSEFYDNIQNLKKIFNKPTPIVSELTVNYTEISPFIPELEKLAGARMKLRHWQQLYSESGHSDMYNENVTIQDLINLGILNDSKRIDTITIQSNGESKIENSFQAIKNHWVNIHIPLKDEEVQDPTKLAIGNTDILIQDIHDSAISLNKMLADKFVAGIKGDVLQLAQTLDLILRVVEQWEVFQSNWAILQPLFSQDIVKNALPNQATRFNVIQAKWKAIAESTLSDTKIFSVCSYPTIIEDFTDNNHQIEDILLSLNDYLELKRSAIPRLYFISNEEVLKLISTTDFGVFTEQISKVLMNIIRLDAHSIGSSESVSPNSDGAGSNFADLKIFGVAGEDGDILTLSEPVSCSGQIEEWIPDLFSSMQKSMKETLSVSLSRYSSSPLNKWLMTVSTYIAAITLNISFTRDIEDCFNNLEANPRSFRQYETTLKHKVQELMTAMNNPISANEIQKISSILTLILYQFEKAHIFTDRKSSHNWKIDWENCFCYKYDTASMNVLLNYRDNTWEHGLEYWGMAPSTIITPAIEQAIVNLCAARAGGDVPIVYGLNGAGKTNLLHFYASVFGKFIFHTPTYNDLSIFYIRKIILGAVLTGSWVHFSHIKEFSKEAQAFIFDNIASIMQSKAVGTNKYIVNDTPLQISPSVCFFYSCGVNEMQNTEISPALRQFARPVALALPLAKKIIEAKLISFGFKSAQTLSQTLEDFLVASISIFKLPNGMRHHAIQITNQAQDTLRQLLHSCKVDFVNYYEDPAKAEAYSVTRAAYFYIANSISVYYTPVLIQVLYKFFPLFDDIGTFEKNVTGHFQFKIDKVWYSVEASLKEYIESIGSNLPVDYLVQKTFALCNLIMNYSCVIICGQPNSGKSFIVKLLEFVYQKFSQNVEIVNTFKGIMPLKIEDIYQNSDSWENIFGAVTNVEPDRKQWSYGLLQNVISRLETFRKTNHRIIRFDGHVTKRFAQFLSQFVADPAALRLNTLGTHLRNNSFNIIVETDTIESITPEMLSLVGIIHLNNMQHSRGIIENYSLNTINIPSIPFLIAASSFPDVPNDYIQEIGTIYTRFVPSICQTVQACPNEIPINDSLDKLIAEAAMYAIYKITSQEIRGDEKLMSWIFGYSFFHVFAACIKEGARDNLQKSIISIFNIELPETWDSWVLPDPFIAEFPKPDLMTTEVTKEGIVPIDTSAVNEKPRYDKTSDGKEPLFPSSVIVVIPQTVPVMHDITYAIKYNRNLMIYGADSQTRVGVLKRILLNFTDLIPLKINVSPNTKTSDILTIIKYQTSVMTKSLVQIGNEKTYILILDGVSKANTEIIELVRQIITEKSISIGSHSDSKFLDHVQIKNFRICISANTVDELPARFSSLFFPVQFASVSSFSRTFILRKILSAYGVNSSFGDYFIPIALNYFCYEEIRYALIHAVHSPAKRFETDDEKITMLSTLCSMLYFVAPGSLFSKDKEVKKILAEMFPETPIVTKFLNLIDEENFITNTTFLFSPPDCNYIANTESATTSITKSKLIVQMRSSVTAETVFSFSFIDMILATPFSRVALTSTVGSLRMFIVKQVCLARGYKLYDFSGTSFTLKDLQQPFNSAVYDNKVQVIVIHVDETTKEELNVVSSAFIDFNFLLLFTEEEFISVVKKIQHKEDPTTDDKFEAIEKIKNILMSLIRVVVLNDTKEKIKDFTDFNILYPCKQELCKNVIDEERREQLTPLFIAISECLEKYIPNKSITMFNDFVFEFRASATGIMSRAVTKNENLSSSITYFEGLKELLQKIEDEITVVTPTLEDLRDKNEGLKNAYTSKHDVIEMRRLKLNEESMYKTRALRESKREVDKLDDKLKALVPPLEKIYDEIAEVTEADLKPISINSGNPSEAVKLAFTVLPTLLGEPGNYETNGVKLMEKDKFAHLIHDGIDYKKIREEHINLIRQTLNNEEFSMAKLEQIAPVLVLIRRFFEAIDKYRQQADIVLERKLQYNVEEKELENFHEDMKRELESMSEIEEQFVDDAKELKAVGADLAKLENQYQVLLARKANAISILENTDPLISNWTIEQEKIGKGDSDTMTGDVILVSAYIAYCGSLDAEQREQAMISATAILNANGIATSYQNPVKDVGNRIVAQNKVPIPHELVSHSALIDLEHMLAVRRIPILIDADKVITESLCEIAPAIRVSLLSSNFQAMVKMAADEGEFVIVSDVDQMTSSLLSLIDFKPCEENSPIYIDGKAIVPKSGFRVILLTNISDAESIDPLLFEMFVPISVAASSSDVIRSRIVRSVVCCSSPDLLERFDHTNAAELEHQVQTGQREFDLLSILAKTAKAADSQGGYLSDNEGLKPLFEAKELYFASINGSPESHAVLEEIDDLVQPLNDAINFMQTLWICIARYLVKASPAYRFKFCMYEKLIMDYMKSNKNRENLKRDLLNGVINWIGPSILVRDLYFLLTLTTFLTEDVPWEDLSTIINNLADSMDRPYKFDNKLIMSPLVMMRECSLPDFAELLGNFINQRYGDVSQMIPAFYTENLLPHNGSTPSIIISPETIDPFPEFFQYAKTRARLDTLESITLTEDNIEETKRIINTSMSRGAWLFLHYVFPSKKTASLINAIPEMLVGKTISINFRVIISCHTVDYISSALFMMSKKISIDSLPSVRNIMVKALHDNGQTLRAALRVKPVRRLFHASLLAYSALSIRSFVPPLGLQHSAPLRPSIIQEMFSLLNCYINQMDDIPLNMVNMRLLIQEVAFGSNAIESMDRRVIRAILATVMPGSCLDDNFNCLKDARNKELYQQPSDGPLQVYQTQIASIPFCPQSELVFAKNDTANLLLQVQVSKWFSVPFLSIYSRKSNNMTSDEVVQRVNDLLPQVPQPIPGVGKVPDTPLLVFWSQEAALFNNDVSRIFKAFSKPLSIAKEIEENKVPKEWDSRLPKFEDYLSTLEKRRERLAFFLAHPIPDSIDASIIRRPREFIAAYAAETGKDTCLSFVANGVAITGLWSFNCCVEGRKLVQSNDLFARLPPLYLSSMAVIAPTRIFRVPIFESLNAGEQGLITEAALITELPDRFLLLNNIAFYWEIPEQYK